MMPKETKAAVDWALGQEVVYEEFGITVTISCNTPIELVEKVCDYFDDHEIPYGTFDYYDIKPYCQ